MPNNWISHVKSFADKKKIKYTDAFKSQECKEEYQKNKPKSSDDMKQDMNKVIMKAPKVSKASKVKLQMPELPKADTNNVEVKIKAPRMRKSKVI